MIATRKNVSYCKHCHQFDFLMENVSHKCKKNLKSNKIKPLKTNDSKNNSETKENVIKQKESLSTSEEEGVWKSSNTDNIKTHKVIDGDDCVLPRKHQKHNHEHNGHEHNHDHGAGLKKWRLILSWILLVPFLILLLGSLFGFKDQLPSVFENGWFQLGLATLIFITIGWVFIQETYLDAKEKHLSVEILVTISTTFAYIFSLISLLLFTFNVIDNVMYFFEAAAEVWVIIYSGRYLEKAVKSRAFNEIEALKNLIPTNASLIKEDGKIVEIDALELKVGDIVLVRKGEVIPSDGIIIEGKSIILESTFTGETANFEKIIGDKVIGGTISTTEQIKVKIETIQENSLINQILDGIQNTKSYRAKTQNIADKIASYLIPAVLVISIIALLSWGFTTNDWYSAISIMIAVMVIACPCSLGLTTPTSILMGSSVASNLGIFFNSKNVFESFEEVDVIALDKTGTITTGEIELLNHNLTKKHLSLVKSVEKNFVHPIAKALFNNIDAPLLNETDFTFEEIESLGIKIVYQNETFYLGSDKLVRNLQSNKTFEEAKKIKQLRLNGSIIIYLFDYKGEVIGYFELGDRIKQTTIEAIKRFHARGIEVHMITGDNQDTANYVGAKIGLAPSNIHAGVLPLDKKDIIESFQKAGKNVTFVGDGNNDAAAMKQADLSISMNSGSDIAVNISDVTVLENDLLAIEDVFYLSKKTLGNIYRGFFLSITYNVIAIPIAAFGFLLPIFAAALMAFSDTFALFNSMTLRLILLKKEYRQKRKQIKIVKKEQANLLK